MNRLVGRLVGALVLAALLPSIVGLVVSLVRQVSREVQLLPSAGGQGTEATGGWWAIPAALFVVGLVVRLLEARHDPSSRRRLRADRERLRRTVRRPAEDIPAFGEAREAPPDDDPTLPLGGV